MYLHRSQSRRWTASSNLYTTTLQSICECVRIYIHSDNTKEGRRLACQLASTRSSQSVSGVIDSTVVTDRQTHKRGRRRKGWNSDTLIFSTWLAVSTKQVRMHRCTYALRFMFLHTCNFRFKDLLGAKRGCETRKQKWKKKHGRDRRER